MEGRGTQSYLHQGDDSAALLRRDRRVRNRKSVDKFQFKKHLRETELESERVQLDKENRTMWKVLKVLDESKFGLVRASDRSVQETVTNQKESGRSNATSVG